LPVLWERKGQAASSTGQVDSIHSVDAGTQWKTIACEKTTRTCGSAMAGIRERAISAACHLKLIKSGKSW
jgi:hypothetical protein